MRIRELRQIARVIKDLPFFHNKDLCCDSDCIYVRENQKIIQTYVFNEYTTKEYPNLESFCLTRLCVYERFEGIRYKTRDTEPNRTPPQITYQIEYWSSDRQKIKKTREHQTRTMALLEACVECFVKDKKYE